MGLTVMTRPQWQTAKDLWVSGFSAADLSARYGVKKCTIYSYAHRHNWPPHPNAKTGKHRLRSKGTQQTLEYPGDSDSTALQTGEALDANPVAVQAGERFREGARVTQEHLRLARMVRARLEDLLVQERVEEERPGRALLELAQALDRVVRIERAALDLDGVRGTAAPVIIVVPAKAAEDVWAAQAARLQAG